MNKWFKVSGTVAMIAAAGVLTVSTISYAQSTEGAPENSDTSGPVERGNRGHRGGERGGFDGVKPDQAEQAALFADALDISVEELEAAKAAGTSKQALIEELGLDAEAVQAALQAAVVAQIQAKVADGTITQEQAERMIERAENGEKGSRHGKRGGQHSGRNGASPEVMADALGISVEELEAAKAEGKNSRELIEELGLDQEAVQANLQAAKIAQIQAQVGEGTITQEQADQMIERAESGQKGVGQRGGRRGGGERGGERGGQRNGGQRGGPQGDDTQQQGLRGFGASNNQDA